MGQKRGRRRWNPWCAPAVSYGRARKLAAADNRAIDPLRIGSAVPLIVRRLAQP
jgi:hypothetical protein